MADRHTSAQRSANMSRVRSRNTRPELVVRKSIHAAGFRYRLHAPELPGKPDILLPRFGLAVFINGCFWHGHNCTRGARPSTNIEFWNKKLEKNVARDKEAYQALRAQGWHVRIIWECSLKTDVDNLLAELRTARTSELGLSVSN